jgi:hypothetical protein
MKFECGDLERALANSDLMPEAVEHLKTCAVCRNEYRLWKDLSSVAKELHEEWETPGLWSKIRQELQSERPPEVVWWRTWKTWAIAAALVVALLTPLLLMRQSTKQGAGSQDFLTEQALVDVERSEAAYRKSIETLARLAKPELENTGSASAVNTREKLLMLDSAIDDTRNNIASNRFNVQLQTTLADLYREKQQTLQELLVRDQKN